MNRRKFLSMAAAVAALPAADLLAAPIKPTLPDVFVIAGPSKSGKSLLAAELAIARAGGRSTFLGRFSVTQGRTLHLDDQHSFGVLNERLHKIAAPINPVDLELYRPNNPFQEKFSVTLEQMADDLVRFKIQHLVVDSMSIFDRCTYTFREDGADITKLFPFDRDFRRHAGEGVLTDLLRERGITCAFTCSQNTEPVSGDPADCVRRDNERHETRDAIVIRRPFDSSVAGVRIFHGPTRMRRLSGRGAFSKMFHPDGEPHRINSETLRFEYAR